MHAFIYFIFQFARPATRLAPGPDSTDYYRQISIDIAIDIIHFQQLNIML
jgi:hypothetical protein